MEATDAAEAAEAASEASEASEAADATEEAVVQAFSMCLYSRIACAAGDSQCCVVR